MAQNYISRGEVITVKAERQYASGDPYRINGFNGVALLATDIGETLSLQLEGVFEFAAHENEEFPVAVGDAIYIRPDNTLHTVATTDEDKPDTHLFGRAVTGSDANGKFYCRLLQS